MRGGGTHRRQRKRPPLTPTLCRFELDNLGGDCTIDDCLMAACRFVDCSWTTRADDGKRDITRTRWLGCTHERCEGFDGMF